MKLKNFLLAITALMLLCATTVQAKAVLTTSGQIDEATKLANKAATDLRELMQARDTAIPQNVLDSARCVAVFPRVIKAAFIVGGRAGDGIASCRDPQTGQWSAPIFLELKGGSVGWQIGAEAIELVLLGMNEDAVKSLSTGDFKLGADASVAAGPFGRQVEASTNVPKFNTAFLSYSRSKGAYVGVSIEGATIRRDNDENVAVYGSGAATEHILMGHYKTPGTVAVFPQTLATYSKTYTAMTKSKDQKKHHEAKGSWAEASKLAADAAEDFRELMQAPDTAIPSNVLDSAHCVAVFPRVIKAAFIVGGRAGDGIASCRDPQTGHWGAPIFLELKGGSIGWQIGAEAVELVLLGLNEDAVKALSRDNFKLGADASIAAGPFGRQAGASVDVPKLNTAFVSYSRSKGAYVGVSFEGASISLDSDENAAVYGPQVSTEQVIGSRRNVPADIRIFQNTLAHYSSTHQPMSHMMKDKMNKATHKMDHMKHKDKAHKKSKGSKKPN